MIKLFISLCVLTISISSFSQNPIINTAGSLKSARYLHESQLLQDGRVLVFGGDNGMYTGEQIFNSAEIYNPGSNSWTNTSNMNNRRSQFASVVLPNGNILAIGGADENQKSQATCEVYNASTGNWTYVASMNQPRQWHEAILLKNGKVLIVGGSDNFDTNTELYDPSNDSWSYTGQLNIQRGGGVSLVTLKDGRILATGGTNYTAANVGELYDPTTQTWTKINSPMVRSRAYHTSILLNDGKVLIVGTGNGNYTDQVTPEIYNPTYNSFYASALMPTNIGRSEMVLMDDGRVLLYGIGDIFSPGDTKNIQVFNPTTSQWTTDTYSFIGANGYTIHRLNNGQILIVAGNWTTGNGASDQCLLLSQTGYNSCIPPNLNLTVTGQTICYGKDGTVSVSGTESGCTYQPYLNDVAVGTEVAGGGNIILNVSSNSLFVGENLVKIIVRKNGCAFTALSNKAKIIATQSSIATPTITSSGNLNFCPGNNVTLIASSGSTYLWSNGSTLQSINVNQTGVYSVKVFDANGCASPTSLEVKTNVYSNTITAGANENICQNGGTVTLSGNYPPEGTWTGMGVTANGIYDPVAVSPGTYTLTYSQCFKSATKTVTVISTPSINDFSIKSLADSTCKGSSTSIIVNNPMIGATYQIRYGSTAIGTPYYNNGTTALYFNTGTINQTTLFNIRGTVSNQCATAEIIKEYNIKVLPTPYAQVVVTPDTICIPGSTIFKIAASQPYFKYKIQTYSYTGSYTNGNGDTLVLKGPAASKDGSGNWLSFQVMVNNSLNCGDVTIYNKPIAGYNHKADFYISPGYFSSESVQLTNRSNGDKYQWKFDNTATISSSTLQNPPAYNYTSLGTKEVRLISQSRFGCSDTIKRYTNIYTTANTSTGSSCFLDTISTNPQFEQYPDLTSKYGITDLHVDIHNNSYVAGYTYTQYTGGNYSGSYNMYLKKIGPTGNLLWEIKQKALDYSYSWLYYSTFITGVTTDAADNVYITGSFTNTFFKIGSISTPAMNNPYTESFILKINSAGVAQWIIYGVNSNTYEAGGTDILYVNDDHIYVTLYRPDKVKFTDGTIQDFNNELIVAQIDKDGKYIKSFTSTNIDYGNNNYSGNVSNFNPDQSGYYTGKIITIAPKMKLSSDGKIFMEGRHRISLGYGSFTLPGISNPTGAESYMAVLDTAAGWQNLFPLYIDGYKYGNSNVVDNSLYFSLDQSNNIYVTDNYVKGSSKTFIYLPNNIILGDSSGSFIAKYNSNGTLLWYNHSALSYPRGIEYLSGTNELITFGAFDNVYMGQTSQSYPLKAIKSSGMTDAYLASTSPDGNNNWIEPIGSKGNDLAFGITSNSCSDVVLLGKIDQRGGIKSDSIINSKGRLFLSRFSPSGNCVTSCNSVKPPLKVTVYSTKDYRSHLSPMPLYIKFNRDVTGFDASDLIITNATLSGFTGSGANYSALLTPAANGITITVQIPANTATDGTVTNLASNLFSIIYDNTPPAISITSTSPSNFNTSSITISITSTDGLIDFTSSDLQLTNCNVSSFSGSGRNYTATIVPIKEGNLSISIPTGVALDSADNANTSSNVLARVYDVTKPKGTITTLANPTATSPIPITIQFSEPVTGFTSTDLSISPSGTVVSNFSNPSGDQMTFTANVNATTSGNYSITISSGYLTDLAGNTNNSISTSITYDLTKPTVSITSSASATTNVSPIPFTVTFSEKVYGLTANSFLITNGVISTMTGSGSQYNLIITPTASGVVSLQLPADVVQDTVGNKNTASAVLSRTFDQDKPGVTISSTSSNPTNISSIPISFTWSENITGFSASDLYITNGTITSITGSGKTYSATLSPIGQGSITIKVLANSVQDAALNSNSESSLFVTKFDNIRPTATITSPSSNPTTDAVVSITITFNETVTNFTASDIIGNNITLSDFTGSGKVYSFIITPTTVGGFGFAINANSLSDLAGNGNNYINYNNTFQGNDVTNPTVTISSTYSSPTNANPIPITFTFSEVVTGFTSSDVIVSNGSLSGFTGSGSIYKANVIPSNSGTVTIKVNANVCTDAALNPNDASSLFSILFDNIKPVATITSTSTNPSPQPIIPITITFTEPITDFTLTDFTVTNGTISNLIGNGTMYNADLTATTEGMVSIVINSNSVKDSAGNTNAISSASFTYKLMDTTNPSLVISSSVGSSTNQSSIPLTFTFTEMVTGFTSTDITVNNGSISNFAGVGTTYTATLTPVKEGMVVISVGTNMAFDTASNGNNPAAYSLNYDISSPMATITSDVSDTITYSSFVMNITFSEDVTFSIDDLSLTNATISNFQKSGNVYTVLVSPTTEGTVSISLTNAIVFDNAGNSSTPASFKIMYATSINGITSSNTIGTILIYPNPSDNLVYIENLSNKEGLTFTITTIEGLTIVRETVFGSISKLQIDLSSLKEGPYVIQLKQQSEVSNKLLIIQR
jgi:hypothetical protein